MFAKRTQHKCSFKPLTTFSNGLLVECCECGRTRANEQIMSPPPIEVGEVMICDKRDNRRKYSTGTRCRLVARTEAMLVNSTELLLWSF